MASEERYILMCSARELPFARGTSADLGTGGLLIFVSKGSQSPASVHSGRPYQLFSALPPSQQDPSRYESFRGVEQSGWEG